MPDPTGRQAGRVEPDDRSIPEDEPPDEEEPGQEDPE